MLVVRMKISVFPCMLDVIRWMFIRLTKTPQHTFYVYYFLQCLVFFRVDDTNDLCCSETVDTLQSTLLHVMNLFWLKLSDYISNISGRRNLNRVPER
jgi:hypothetical protein